MQRIGIGIKPGDARATALAVVLHERLTARGMQVHVCEELASALPEAAIPIEMMTGLVDLMVSLGGDGTLLYVARRFVGHGTPILGINLGRLGFLTEAPATDAFDAVDQALQGKLKSKRHFALRAECWRGEEQIAAGIAFNDVVLQRGEHPRMIEFEMQARGQFLFRLRADGLVLATPAGSTAYALSSGGPIVHPEVEAISVVPICPHTLSNRPIVLPAGDRIELRLLDAPRHALLNLDGQENMKLHPGDRVTVVRGDEVTLLHQPDRHYFEVLRTKLQWAGQAVVQGMERG